MAKIFQECCSWILQDPSGILGNLYCKITNNTCKLINFGGFLQVQESIVFLVTLFGVVLFYIVRAPVTAE